MKKVKMSVLATIVLIFIGSVNVFASAPVGPTAATQSDPYLTTIVTTIKTVLGW